MLFSHTTMIIISSSFDIAFGIGKVLPLILTVNIIAVINDCFGFFALFKRIKTEMLFYTLCAIGFFILMVCIEITYEMRNYVFGQNSEK